MHKIELTPEEYVTTIKALNNAISFNKAVFEGMESSEKEIKDYKKLIKKLQRIKENERA